MSNEGGERLGLEMKQTFPKVSTILGSFLVLLPGRPEHYWGNMSIYVLSYIIMGHQTDQSIQPAWLSTIYGISWSTGMIVDDRLAGFIGTKSVIFSGIMIFNLAVFLNYFTLELSVSFFIIVFGLLTGLGNGLVEGLVFKNFVVPLTTTKPGKMTSIVICGAVTGSIAIDQYVTRYINPDNLSPTTTRSKIILFSQEEILDRVPLLFLILGGVTSLVQLTGFFLLRRTKKMEVNRDETELTEYSMIDPEENRTQANNFFTFETESNNSSSRSATAAANGNATSGTATDSDNNITSLELLKSPMFYKLWFLNFSAISSRTTTEAYYKIYGQTHIHDDHFLMNVGTSMMFVSIVMILVWGHIIDVVRLKICHLVIQFILATCNLFIYFAPFLNKWVYSVVCCIMTCATAPLYMCFTVSLVLLFGNEQLNVKMAILSTASLFAALLSSVMAEIILNELDWFYLFLWPGALAFSSFILVIYKFPEE